MADEDDESLAHRLLFGWYVYDEKGRPQKQEYFKPEEEQEGRAALARLLRSGKPLPEELSNMLAYLFEGVAYRIPLPDTDTDLIQPSERRLVFTKPIKQVDSTRRIAIARHVWREFRKHGKVEAAVESAAKHYLP
jgi:hypothetical protein